MRHHVSSVPSSGSGGTAEAEPRVFAAAREGDHEHLRRLIDGGGDVSAKWHLPQNLQQWDDGIKAWRKRPGKGSEWGPLAVAARVGNAQCVRVLLEHGPCQEQTQARDPDGYTPLRLAAQWGHADCVDVILGQSGVEVDSADNWGETSLMWASRGGWDDSVDRRLEAGDDQELYWERSAYPRIVGALLVAGSNAGLRDDRGFTALKHAACTANVDVMRVLTAADNFRQEHMCEDDTGEWGTALLWVVDPERRVPGAEALACVEHLIGVGADIHSPSNDEAFEQAFEAGNFQVCEYLLHIKADKTRRDASALEPESEPELEPEPEPESETRASAFPPRFFADKYYTKEMRMAAARVAKSGCLYKMDDRQRRHALIDGGKLPTPLAFWAATIAHPALLEFLQTGDVPNSWLLARDLHGTEEGWTIGHHLAQADCVAGLQSMCVFDVDLDSLLDASGVSVLEKAKQKRGSLNIWALRYDSYAGRFQLREGRPRYMSGTSTVYEADDIDILAQAESDTEASQARADKEAIDKKVMAIQDAGTAFSSLSEIERSLENETEGNYEHSAYKRRYEELVAAATEGSEGSEGSDESEESGSGSGSETEDAEAPQHMLPDKTSTEDPRVAIKIMTNEADWERECASRTGLGELLSGSVVPILHRQYVSGKERIRRERKLALYSGCDTHDIDLSPDKGEWMIVLPLADCSLDDIISKERQAGRSPEFAAAVARDVAHCLHQLHTEHSIIHNDVKPLNICCFKNVSLEGHVSVSYKLIDLEGVTKIGECNAVQKPSEAYMPPEAAQSHLLGPKFNAGRKELEAHESADVWAIGAVLFELLSAVPLFPSERADGMLVDSRSKLELLNWRTVDAERLEQILPCSAEDVRNAACELVAWCLQSDPKKRPTMLEVVNHRFVSMVGPKQQTRPMLTFGARATDEPMLTFALSATWHFFLSHMQIEANDLVRTLFLMSEKNGCRIWLDMEADDLTLPGMRAGVRNSESLLLVLTKSVLFRPFCIAEIYEAILADKNIVLVSEEDPRSDVCWDFAAWQQQWDGREATEIEDEMAAKQTKLDLATAGGDWREVRVLARQLEDLEKQVHTQKSDYSWCLNQLASGDFGFGGLDGAKAVMDEVGAMIRKGRTSVIPFRRRNFEMRATLAEIFSRCSLHTDVQLRPTGDGASPATLERHDAHGMQLHVAITGSTASGSLIMQSLQQALAARGLEAEVTDEVERSCRALIVLTEGTMSDPMVLESIRKVQRVQRAAAQSEDGLSYVLVVVQDDNERAGSEARSAPADIKPIFISHEFLTFRVGDERLEHERVALVDELVRRFERLENQPRRDA